MSKEYRPEYVQHLVKEGRTIHCADCDHFISGMSDALETVSADRDRLHKAITEALDHDPLHGRSRLHVILRAALEN